MGYEYTQENKYSYQIRFPNQSSMEEALFIQAKARHSDWNRTWVVPTDWFLTLGASSLVGGFFVTKFDPRTQSEFQKQGTPFADSHLALQLARRISEILSPPNLEDPLEN